MCPPSLFCVARWDLLRYFRLSQAILAQRAESVSGNFRVILGRTDVRTKAKRLKVCTRNQEKGYRALQVQRGRSKCAMSQKRASDPPPHDIQGKHMNKIRTKYGPKGFKTRQHSTVLRPYICSSFCLYVGFGVAKWFPDVTSLLAHFLRLVSSRSCGLVCHDAMQQSRGLLGEYRSSQIPWCSFQSCLNLIVMTQSLSFAFF